MDGERTINGGAKGQCPVMEIALEGEKLLPYIGAKRQGEYGCVCVCVWVVGFM